VHATGKVINLLTDHQRLVSLVSSRTGDGPHNIVLQTKGFASLPAIGQKAHFVDMLVRVNGLEVDLSQAVLWEARPDWASIRSRIKVVRDHSPALCALLVEETPDDGALPLVGEVSVHSSGFENHFSAALMQPAALLTHGLIEADRAAAFEGASRAAGLGTGLTPAGDDYICGTMLACWAGVADGQVLEWLPELAEQAAAETSQLSAAYLRSAAAGLCGQRWHSFLESIVKPDMGQWRPDMRAITHIGHNSGAFTLAGFISMLQ
jgi:hypothetical protein